jgi:RHS repeat-associated protein
LVQQYVFGRYIDEPLVLDRNLTGGTQATGPGNQRLFYHQNKQHSIFALTDITGKIVEGYQYKGYGTPTVFDSSNNGVVTFGSNDMVTVGGASAFRNPYAFTGRRYDPESGLYYYRNRYMSPDQGRFISRDPIGYQGGSVSLYEYVANRPSSLLDPSGLTPPIDNPPGAIFGCLFAGLAFGDDYARGCLNLPDKPASSTSTASPVSIWLSPEGPPPNYLEGIGIDVGIDPDPFAANPRKTSQTTPSPSQVQAQDQAQQQAANASSKAAGSADTAGQCLNQANQDLSYAENVESTLESANPPASPEAIAQAQAAVQKAQAAVQEAQTAYDRANGDYQQAQQDLGQLDGNPADRWCAVRSPQEEASDAQTAASDAQTAASDAQTAASNAQSAASDAQNAVQQYANSLNSGSSGGSDDSWNNFWNSLGDDWNSFWNSSFGQILGHLLEGPPGALGNAGDGGGGGGDGSDDPSTIWIYGIPY